MATPQLLCADCITNDAGEQFSLWLGLNNHHQQAVIEATKHDQMIINNTGDAERFSSLEKLTDWLSGNRLFYILTPKEKPNELAGLIWFSAEDLREELANQLEAKTDWTFAIRLYEQARGQHLSTPFMQQAFKYFWQDHPEQPVWLSTQADNELAKKIYQKYGFKLIGELANRAYYLLNPVQ